MILTYDDLKVELLHVTPEPAKLVDLAAQHCFKNPQDIEAREKTDTLIKFLLKAEHTSPLEHVNYTFRINNFSRSGLAQLTRHRHASYTVTSQHYQEYSDYPFIIDPKFNGSVIQDMFKDDFAAMLDMYKFFIESDVPKEEARQLLPNAMSCGLVMTINARSLVNFLRLRLCKRNCAEILNLAHRFHDIGKLTFPELFYRVHAPCVMDGKCNQGRMSCGNPY